MYSHTMRCDKLHEERVPEMVILLGLKGYLRYKTTTSQNVSSDAQVKNCFIF